MSSANMPAASGWPFTEQKSEAVRVAEACLGHGGFNIKGRCRAGEWSGGNWAVASVSSMGVLLPVGMGVLLPVGMGVLLPMGMGILLSASSVA